ncbi:MAG TPA: hypothetical protein ENH62_17535 [Marinobacter sp.]|uniref:Uncharacterized protein n=1 Tax=marine sediment metagenome TaxID=412755 RepID=A0A0F9QXD8_9ZZZZ|nr:hypothetical protein [Marinobacter sp.]
MTADPAAIDILGSQAILDHDGYLPMREARGLIAAVKTLRERVAELENRYKLYKHIAKGVRGALDGEHTQRDILEVFDATVDRAEAAEARVEILEAEIRAMHKLPAALDAALGKDGP